MSFPAQTHIGTQVQIKRSVQRRAIVLTALQCGIDKDAAAARAGITRGQLNRLIRQDWEAGNARS